MPKKDLCKKLQRFFMCSNALTRRQSYQTHLCACISTYLTQVIFNCDVIHKESGFLLKNYATSQYFKLNYRHKINYHHHYPINLKSYFLEKISLNSPELSSYLQLPS